MKLRAVLVGGGEHLLDWLRLTAGDYLDVQPDESEVPFEAGMSLEAPSQFVFVEFAAPQLSARVKFVESLVEHHPQVPIVAVSASENAELVLAAVRAGARDFFVMGRDDASLGGQVARILQRLSSASMSSEVSVAKGKLFALVGGDAGEGTPFLGEHVALALNETKRPRERVLLLDLSSPAGAAALFLNLAQQYTVVDVLRDAYRCDETLIDTAFPKHSSGLYVLSLPEDVIGAPQVDATEVAELVKTFRSFFAFVVVTVDGQYPLEGVAGLVNAADSSLIVCDQSILKSRRTKHFIRALRDEDCALDRTGLVVDDYRSRLGLEPRNLAELLDLPLVGSLETEKMNRLTAMNSGEALFSVARKDPYCAGVRKLAASMASGSVIPNPKAAAGNPLKRWLG